MQEEVRDKSVALVINVGKNGGRMTASLLKWAMRQYMQQSRNPHIHHGKQTVKQLVRQGAGVQNIEITDKNVMIDFKDRKCRVHAKISAVERIGRYQPAEVKHISTDERLTEDESD